MPDFSNFECDRCGACCESLIVEADYLDALREPKLFQIRPINREKLRDGEHVVMLYDKQTRACPFLQKNKECGIYPTRPMCCVRVEAGDAKCQQSRLIKQLPLLLDKFGRPPSADMLEESCEEYELDLSEVILG